MQTRIAMVAGLLTLSLAALTGCPERNGGHVEYRKGAEHVTVGMTAQEVLQHLSYPVQQLSTEGEACFVFDESPDVEICFEISSEQADWAQVASEQNKVIRIDRPETP